MVLNTTGRPALQDVKSVNPIWKKNEGKAQEAPLSTYGNHVQIDHRTVQKKAATRKCQYVTFSPIQLGPYSLFVN